MKHRCRERLLYRPACSQTRMYSCYIDPHLIGPISQTERRAIVRPQSGSASVARLLMSSRPSTIVRLVVTVVVYAVKAISLAWSVSHICEKISELVPALTYGDATFTVPYKERAGWIQTPAPHVCPCLVFWRSHDHSVTMLPSVVSSKTATTARVSTSQCSGGYYPHGAARTMTDPSVLNAVAVRNDDRADDGQAVEHLANQVWYSTESHAGSSIQGMRVVRGWLPLARLSASLDYTA